METLLNSVSHFSVRATIRTIMTCSTLLLTGFHLHGSPDDLINQTNAHLLSSWNSYGESNAPWESTYEGHAPAVALSCLPNVNISLGMNGSAVITALTLVNAPEYPPHMYVVDIMGPLTNTVYCEQIGQELMVLVTELPTGNSCMSTIYVEDKLRPVLVCTSDTIPCNTDIESIDFENYIESVTDNCDDDVHVWYSYVVQNLPCNPHHLTQQILVNWTATDDYGNSTTCQDVIYLRKPALGQIQFPPNISIPCENADTDPDNTGVPTFNGAPLGHTCQIIWFHTDQVIPMCNGAYKILRLWTVKDWCNSGQRTHVQEILVVDNTPPMITCPPNITVNAGIGICSTSYTLPTPVVSDACAAPNQIDIDIKVNGIPGYFSPGQIVNLGVGTTLITMIATDPCGNSSQCMYTVTVRDNTPPTLICPPHVTVECTESTHPDNTGYATAFDACDDEPTVTYSDVTVETTGCALGYRIIRTWRATDDSGNTITCMQMIELTDDSPPTITCPANVTIDCTDDSSPAANGMATATDACDENPAISSSDLIGDGSCPQEFVISRIWSATDDCGNVGTCVQLIFVEDNTAPEVTCPDDMTIECTDSTDPSATGEATAVDDCDPNPTTTYSDEIIPAGPQKYTLNRTWIASDACGNTSTCLQVVLVHDDTPPTIFCPDDIVVSCTDSTDPLATGTATATDNCDPTLDISFSDVVEDGDCPAESTISRTWIATDDCGNTSTCVQIITVDDSEGPTITCPDNITISCTDSPLPLNTGEASATDECDEAPFIEYTDAIAGGSCPREFTITRTWIATDDCGNSSTCAQVIVIEDSVPPVITCPANTTIQCSESTLPQNTGLATASDLCDNAPAIDFDDVIEEGDCEEEYTIFRTWTATDDCGNASTCQQTISVVDTQAPAITCPSSVTIECTESTLPATTGTATATDNCDITPSITYADVTIVGSCPQAYSITRTWSATDGCGNSTACIQIIVIEDSVAPVISCPSNITIECGEDTDPDSTGGATAVDNCDDDPSINFTDMILAGSCAQEFTINRTWSAEDACGNISTCLQTIFIDDNIAPTIICPDDVTITCTDDTLPVSTGFAVATDNCDTSPSVTYADVTTGGTCPEQYTITRTWVATDDCGNSSTCNQIIQVDDTEAPEITCPPNLSIDCADSTLPDVTGMATASDSCDEAPEVGFTDAMVDGDCAQSFTIERTWTATDACGNTSTCLQTIDVSDDEAPAITCPADVTINCDLSTDPEVLGEATATDNCSGIIDITFEDVSSGGPCPLPLIITRTWTATDECGNASTCEQIITEIDNVPPVISCPANLTVECDESTDPVATGLATATDVCDTSPEVTYSDEIEDGDCDQAYTITRTWVAADECGNTSTCVQTILVEDSTSPILTCPTNLTLECNDDTAPESTGFASATDNCDGLPEVDYSDVTIGGDCPQGYIITRTWTAIDDCGNESTCVQTIEVGDNEAPLVFCPDDVVIDCSETTDPSNTGNATASDACDIDPDVTFIDQVVNGACPQEFTIMRTWTATDECDNIATCVQMIDVEDTTAPVCLAVDLTVSINGNGMVTILPAQVDGGSTDDCGAVVLSVEPNTFTCDDLGENLVVLTVTDCPGNSSTCTAIVTVEDSGSLEAFCQDVIIMIDADGNASVNPEDIDNGSGGGCTPGELEFDLSQTDFDCSDLGPNIVILTVTDEDGNTATCTATVTVVDLIPPAITCPPNLTVDCHEVTDPENTSQFGDATATDNCPGAFITETHVIDLSDCNVGTIIRTFTATDLSGNTATCTQVVTIENPAPLNEDNIIWPDSPVSVDICNSTDPDDIPNGEPEFDPVALLCADPDVSFEDDVDFFIDNNPNTACRVITRTWTVVDECQPNGTFTFVQIINVQDAVPPVFVNINDMTKVANNNCVAAFTIIASATDCAGVTITNNSPYGTNSGANASGNYPIGVTVVIFTATDGCGNISTMDVVITVTDPDPTTFMCEKTIIILPEESEITIPADTFATIINGNCTTADDVLVSYSGTDPFDSLRTFDCGDVGVSTFPLWLWNEAGTMILDSCNTADLDLRDPLDHCGDGLGLFGHVENENGLEVSGVEVSIMNAPMIPDTTNHAGQYFLTGLQEGTGYRVAPFDDDHHREGVSTLDLVMIQKHLLGKAKLNSPYKIIAADANKSGSVTAIDLLEIRKLILGLNQRFPNNTSWRFIDREYGFIDPYNPFIPQFPESVWMDSVSGDVDTVDFVAIKIGDVNGSYFSKATDEEIKPRSGSSYTMSLGNAEIPAGGLQRMELKALPGQSRLNGFQFSVGPVYLTPDQVSSIGSELLTPDQWYYNPITNTISVSWSTDNEVDLTGTIILSIPGEVALGALMIRTELMEPEGYLVEEHETTIKVIDILIEGPEALAEGDYQLFQNIPNPFNDQTRIRYSLPKEEWITLKIHDMAGRLIYTIETMGLTGMNEISIRNRDLGENGIYYYTLHTQNASFTRKMSLIHN